MGSILKRNIKIWLFQKFVNNFKELVEHLHLSRNKIKRRKKLNICVWVKIKYKQNKQSHKKSGGWVDRCIGGLKAVLRIANNNTKLAFKSNT